MSERKYEKVRRVAQLPSYYHLKKIKKDIDSIFNINENSLGFYNEPIEKIKFVIERFIEKSQIENSEVINIKIGIDGLQLTKTHRQILNVTFTILNENKRATTSKGNYIIGMVYFLSKKS